MCLTSLTVRHMYIYLKTVPTIKEKSLCRARDGGGVKKRNYT